jgi:hydroxymethylpyrimidine pyrophosphatase-like HAD family hydrolase
MQTLPPVIVPTGLLSFDFDGTLHDPASDPPVPHGFFQLVRWLRRDRGTLWGINTGRSLEHLLEGFKESAFPFLPDWVVAREREIYFTDGNGGWQPHASWNRRCEREIHALFSEAADLMREMRHRIEEHTGAKWFECDGDPAGVIAKTEEEIEWIMGNVIPLADVEPRLAWERNTIYLRFGHRDFNKGTSMAEVARIHRLAAAQCFAIGDSHNDLGMLDPAHAAMTACPANAVAEIRAHVENHGGLVTRAAHGDGAVEALRHYFEVPGEIH